MNDEEFSKLPKEKPQETKTHYSVEAEQGTLGCILLSPQETIPLCIEKLGDKSDAFYDLRHRQIYETCIELWNKKKGIDLITVMQDLRDELKLESVGGLAYLASLPDAVPSAANLEYYLEIVKEKHVLRQMVGTCTEIVSKSYEHKGEIDQLISEVTQDVLAISNAASNKKHLYDANTLAGEGLKRLEEIAALQGKTEGLSTGFPDIDHITSGLKEQEMIVIAARPSVGKSAIALNIADHVAVVDKHPVAVFSLEMSATSLMMRALCSRSRVSMRDIRNGHITPEEIQKLIKARDEIGAAPIYIDDEGGMSISQLRAKARRYHQQYGIKLAIVDYLQLLHSSKRTGNRQEEVGEISRNIKAIAKELGIPIIVLAQLNREIDKDKQRKPKMSDLRESGAIEQDADIIGLLYKPPLPEGETEDPTAPAIKVNLLIAKNRNGEIDDIQLVFLRRFTRFESASKVEIDYPQQ